MLSSPLVTGILAVLVAGCYMLNQRRNANELPLPPGPRRLPLIGNLHQAPAVYPWRTYRSWVKTYGPIMSVQYGKDTVIILSNNKPASDLLDRRSNLYSSRPHLTMAFENVSKGNHSIFMPYGPRHRNHQRIQGGLVNPRFSREYVRLQDLESKQLMVELLNAGEDGWMEPFHRFNSSLIFSLAYGKRMPRGDEEEVKTIGKVMENFLYATRVGTWIVDAIPILNKLPKMLAPWKKTADEFHAYESEFHMRNLKQGLGHRGWNWSKQAMVWKEGKKMPEKELAYCLGTMYEAGSDTSTMALHSFVLAALTYPEAIRDAQRHLDEIVGDRFPTFEDRARLEYVDAVVKEVLRWRPVSPCGVPHAIDTKDDEYMGYLIPKSAVVIPNHWAINMDEEVFGDDTFDFRPSRHIDNPDLPIASWGYGRRVCSGQHIATNTLFLNIARILWAFDIEHAVDEAGNKIKADPWAYTQGVNSGPLPFKARFRARSEERKAIVERMWQVTEKDLSVILHDISHAIAKAA